MKEIIFKDFVIDLIVLYIKREIDTHTIEILKSLLSDVSFLKL